VKAVVHHRYGPPEVLQLEDVQRPTPQEDEVLVKVHASTVTRSDCGFRGAEYFVSRFFTGLLRPKRKIVGMELAGEVEAVGDAVREFAVGDRVFGVRFGANAEFVCVPESGALAHMPASMTFEEAAAVCDGATIALAFIRRARLQPGHRILVYGASGSIGTAAVQLARHVGAHVTAVCDTRHVELVRSLGADEVIDYLQQDFTQNGQSYDVVFDAVGKLTFGRCRGSLTPRGIYAATDGLRNLFFALWTSRIGELRVVFVIPRYTKAGVLFVKGLVEAGEYRAVVDRTFPLEDAVAATRYVETGQKTGNVVLIVAGGPR
jgi:NADPH:quinone reductase-like Zn-dependent oxidoreductase